MAFDIDKINDYANENREKFLAEFAELIAFPSVAAQKRSIDPCADWIVARLEKLGATVEKYPIDGGSPVIVGEIGTGDRTLMVYNHYDVQPETPADLWDSEPFELTRQDGMLIARGAADDKGELLSRIQAVEAWQQTHGELPIKLKFVYEGEEEIGSVHLADWVHAHREKLGADGLLWEGGGYDEAGRVSIAEGCKGILYLELHTSGPAYDLHSSLAPMIENPAWRLVKALASLKNLEDQITIDGYRDHIQRMPSEVIELIDALPFESDKMRANFGLTEWINGIDDREAKRRHYLEPTITICGLTSGYQDEGTKTIIPSSASVKLDFRLVPNLTPELVLELLRTHLDNRGFEDVTIVPLAGEPPAMEPGDSAVRQAAIKACQVVFGQEPILSPWFTGSGPMHALSTELEIPVVSAGATWHPKARAHAPNENIYEADYFKALGIMAVMIDAFASA